MVYLQQGESLVVKGPACFPVDRLLELLACLVERGGIWNSVFVVRDQQSGDKPQRLPMVIWASSTSARMYPVRCSKSYCG